MNTELPSNRKFGLLFSGIFLALAAYFYIQNGLTPPGTAFLVLGLLFLGASFFAANWLTPLNKLWFLLGKALGAVVSPIVLGIIFFVLITPVALMSRWIGRDELKLRRPKSETYWVEPISSDEDPESFKNQF